MKKSSSLSRVNPPSLPDDVQRRLESLPIKIKCMSRKPITKSNKTLVIDLDQCQPTGCDLSKCKSAISHDSVLEGDTTVNPTHSLASRSTDKTTNISSTKHCTEHPAVLMHSDFFQESSRQSDAIRSKESENGKRNGRRRWRREVMEPPRSPPLLPTTTTTATSQQTQSTASPICVRVSGVSPRRSGRSPSSQKSGKSSTVNKVSQGTFAESGGSSLILLNAPDRQAMMAALRRSKSGHVTRSRPEIKVVTCDGVKTKREETLFGFPVRCAPKSADSRQKRHSGVRRQWGKPSFQPEFQEASDVECEINLKVKSSGSSTVSMATSTTTAEGFYHLNQHPSLLNVLTGYVNNKSLQQDKDNFSDRSEGCVEDGAPVKRLIHSRSRGRISVASSSDCADVEIETSQSKTYIVPEFQLRRRVGECDDVVKIERKESRRVVVQESCFSPRNSGNKVQFPFNSIMRMGEMFKSECLNECGSWKTRNKKFAWPQEVLEEALSTLTTNASKAKSAAMQTIGRLAAYYPEVAEGEQLALVRGLTREIRDPRPYVARLALVCLMLLFSRLRFNMIQCLMETCSVLLRVLVTTQCNALQRDIVSALDHLPDLVVPQQAIQVFLTLNDKHSERIIHQTVSKCVSSIIEKRGSGVVLQAHSSLTEMVLSSAVKFCTDFDPQVKANGLKIIRLLESHPSFVIVLKNHVSMETVSAVNPFLKQEIRRD